ncbi:MAG: hypothetical protein ACKO7W_23170 [Elainella sp.]
MSTAPPIQAAAPIACQADTGFQSWLQTSGGSLAISTYQAGRVILVG